MKRDSKLEEFFHAARERGIFAGMVQEHWRVGNEVLVNDGAVLVTSGLSEDQQSKRGSQGVGIYLSRDAAAAWKASGSEKHVDLGARVCAVRIVVTDDKRRKVCLFLVSAYSPVGASSFLQHEEYQGNLDAVIARKQPGDILLVGMDANASMGRGACSDHGFQPVGRYGNRHVNEAGRRLRTYLATHGLFAVSTRFKKTHYSTWMHPSSRKLHQIDHFIMDASEVKRVTDCGTTGVLVDSDHLAIKCTLRIAVRLKKSEPSPRQKLGRRDFGSLRGPPYRTTEAADKNREQFNDLVNDFVSKADRNEFTGKYPMLVAALSYASDILPKRPRPSPGWFEQSKDILLPLIAARNQAMSASLAARRRDLRSVRGRLNACRKALKVAIAQAKCDWIAQYVECMNANDARGGTVSSWQAVGVLKAGLCKTKPVSSCKMKKPDGLFAETPAENAKVFEDHFTKSIFGRTPDGNPDVLNALPQLEVDASLGEKPSTEEYETARRKLRHTAPGKSGLPAAAFKYLDGEASALLYEIVVDVWDQEKQPVEFDVGVLAILAKKGDLSDPGNYRGIMMLEVAYKVVAIILANRCYKICEGLDHENQVGFRPGRGCSDGIFNLRMAIKKRREHGCETWVFFLDLVKAFDRVPREMLWGVLKKFGAPPKLIAMLQALHAKVDVEFEVDGVSKTIASIVGVKQGDVLGPVLFVIYMAAVMMAWRQEHGADAGELCVYRSRNDYVMTGRKGGRLSDEFVLPDSEYADDTAMLFPARDIMAEKIPLVYQHFLAWGMEVHKGRSGSAKVSKSVAMYCAANRPTYDDYSTYDDMDLSPIRFGEDGEYEIPIVCDFKYLGSCVNRDCNDETEVNNRLKSAGNAFGALRCIFRSKKISLRAKRVVYNGLILAILLYGAETWSLTEVLFNRLRTFHAQCVRAMCLVTKRMTWKEHISTEDLEKKLGMQSIDVYVYRRQLAWLGHVSRMGFERIPRKLLSAWVNAPRAACGVEMTYGRALGKAFRYAGLDQETWHVQAQDKLAWRTMLKNL